MSVSQEVLVEQLKQLQLSLESQINVIEQQKEELANKQLPNDVWEQHTFDFQCVSDELAQLNDQRKELQGFLQQSMQKLKELVLSENLHESYNIDVYSQQIDMI